MKVFLTGYSGFLGSNIATRLLNDGMQVKALCRGTNPQKHHEAIEFSQGDLSDTSKLATVLKNCDAVIHAAALTKTWDPDHTQFMQVNYTGTKNLLKACEETGVERFVYVSTAGVIGPTTHIPATESFQKSVNQDDAYVTSKKLAEKEVLKSGENGMNINIVYPSRMYGPGPLNHANSITKMISDFNKGKWFVKPPYGHVIGSYNHVEEVANGVTNALNKGIRGEKYLLAGHNLSYDDFFETLRSVTGKKHLLFSAPYSALYLYGLLQEQYSKLDSTFTAPLNTNQVKRFREHYAFDSTKAAREIGYKVVPFEQGLLRTMEWLSKNNF